MCSSNCDDLIDSFWAKNGHKKGKPKTAPRKSETSKASTPSVTATNPSEMQIRYSRKWQTSVLLMDRIKFASSKRLISIIKTNRKVQLLVTSQRSFSVSFSFSFTSRIPYSKGRNVAWCDPSIDHRLEAAKICDTLNPSARTLSTFKTTHNMNPDQTDPAGSGV